MRLEAEGNNITLKVNDVVVAGPIVDPFNNTVTRQGMLNRSDVEPNSHTYFEAGVLASAEPSITSITSPIIDGSSGNSIAVSSFPADLVSITLRCHEFSSGVASLVGTGDNYTFGLFDVTSLTVDTVGVPFTSANFPLTAEPSDGTNTATTDVVLNPKSGWQRTDFATTLNMAEGSAFHGSSGMQAQSTAVSIASPAQITIAGHGFIDQQKVTLSDFVTTPAINGEHVITVIDANTISIPVNVTAVTDGVGMVITGAPNRHGQFYYDSSLISIAADGTLDVYIASGAVAFFMFDVATGMWKRYEAIVSAGNVVALRSSARFCGTGFADFSRCVTH